MPLALITPAEYSAISLEQAKSHCRIDGTAEDALLSGYIAAAQGEAANRTGRVLVASTWEWSMDEFPANGAALELPLSPATAIKQITYVDAAGEAQTMDPLNYVFIPSGVAYPSPLYASVRPLVDWPQGATDVRIQFVAGWPLDDDDQPTTPGAIKSWMLLAVGSLYAYRERELAGQTVASFDRADRLLDAWTIERVA